MSLEKRIAEEFGTKKGVASVRDDIGLARFELDEILSFFGKDGGGRKLLDVGSGKGIFTAALKSYGFDAEGVEPALTLREIAKERYPYAKFCDGSATALPFPDASFDCLVCVEVLEHVPDTDAALHEFSRVLRPGGKAVVIDNNIFSLHPAYFIPAALWKSLMERMNKWMYPKGFPFREKYFNPWKMRSAMRRHFGSAEIHFLKYNAERRRRSPLRSALSVARGAVASVLHAVLPFLDFYVSWRCVK